jgi:hypothetical protein
VEDLKQPFQALGITQLLCIGSREAVLRARGHEGRYRSLMRNLEYGYLFEQRSASLPITVAIYPP